MNLRITAFGQSPQLTIRQRAEKIMSRHSKFCDIVELYEWEILNRKTDYIDIRNTDVAYPAIYQQTKAGLNAKVVNATRYKEDDIADIPSTCGFYRIKARGINVSYSIGYPSIHYPTLRISVERITDQNLFNKDSILKISKLFIDEWNPCMLCVTDPKYFHDISQVHKLDIPWTGWFTYLHNELVSQSIDFGTDTEQLLNGKLIWTTESYFDPTNNEHIKRAQNLEALFEKHNIRLSSCYT